MGMNIDKPRRDDMAVGINFLLGPALNLADGDNPLALDGHVAAIAFRAGAVNDRAVFDDQVVCHVRLRRFLSRRLPFPQL